MQKGSAKRKQRSPQKQKNQPGKEYLMRPEPEFENPAYKASGKLIGKSAIITGGDSGIGKAAAIAFAKEGCNVTIIYFNEHTDAKNTREIIEKTGQQCFLINGDISKESFCRSAVKKTMKQFGKIDILVNNSAVQYPAESITQISAAQLEKTFRTNIFSMFYLTKHALPYLKEGSAIINTTSVTAYRGSENLIDYASTKGAIVSFTRSLSSSLSKKKIRVNGVAPGPIWTPLIPASFSSSHVESFGSDVPLGRAGQPYEVAPCFVFLASEDSSYMTGQILHPNGGEIVNG
jgi:NAD(P)-dependent dehydrogenase (short-subunit alcohol dehydrogenase family)